MRFGLVQAGVSSVPRLGGREERDGSLLGRGAGALPATVAECDSAECIAAVRVGLTGRWWLGVLAVVAEGNIVLSFNSFGFERLAGDRAEAVAVVVAVKKDRVFLRIAER